MKIGLMRAVVGVAAVCGAAGAAFPVQAGDLSMCMNAQEARAFSLRHLQSRLMVAGLACNQRDAYNSFVEAFRPPLNDAGVDFIGYFQRSGGGQTALNRHVTELANVAGLQRAADPQAFCEETWNMFLLLKDKPFELEAQAIAHVMKDAGAPVLCAAPPPAAPARSLTAEAAGVVKAAVDAPAYTVD
ncbi:MAG: hypothetical protein LCH56_08400 [Proteobacteria bacterium]|nr:hypothetical protein [Pseudomonadota bacterium]